MRRFPRKGAAAIPETGGPGARPGSRRDAEPRATLTRVMRWAKLSNPTTSGRKKCCRSPSRTDDMARSDADGLAGFRIRRREGPAQRELSLEAIATVDRV